MLWAAVLAMTAVAANAETRDPFEALRWKSRVVLIFAQGDREREETQRQALPTRDLRDRDLVVVRVPDDGNLTVPGIGSISGKDVRAAYGIGKDSPFTVLLIGKDGGVKQRSSEPIAARDLFATIDAMPMRRQEMRKD